MVRERASERESKRAHVRFVNGRCYPTYCWNVNDQNICLLADVAQIGPCLSPICFETTTLPPKPGGTL